LPKELIERTQNPATDFSVSPRQNKSLSKFFLQFFASYIILPFVTPKQGDFFKGHREHAPNRRTHGGEGSKHTRKLIRPLSSRKPLHLVLKSSHAKGKLTMRGLENEPAIEEILRKNARQFVVTIHWMQNVGNHIHLVLSFKRRVWFQNFLRTIAALIARQVTKARKGKPFGKPFWDYLAFTRVITGRRDFLGMKNYINKNRIEAEVHPLARKAVEEYQAAEKKAKKLGVDVWRILESG
jgi:REP element-mobilizing transposase RayT